MSLSPLTIIPAGAGSGKTFTIQERLGQWVKDGLVRPDRIVAVTFTEAAAAELRNRIRSKLIALGRSEDALKLDQSYITTIHAFGYRLLKEYAFDLGHSPNPRLLNDDEEEMLIRLALSNTRKADVVAADLKQFGYKYNFYMGQNAEDIFRDGILGIVKLLRSIGRSEESTASLIPDAIQWIKEMYGETGDGEQLTKNLHQAVRRLLKKYPVNLSSEYGNNKAATKKLDADYRHLRKAENRNNLEKQWDLWNSLRTMRVSGRGNLLPEDYIELAEHVMEAANQLPFHPGPLKEAITHAEALIGAGEEILLRYGTAKRESGLVDYTDMVATAHQLLNLDAAVLNIFKNRIDCLVIDEFQDTNPLQFALLWKLREAGVPTLVVGDLKQAIMGFQLADPRLLEQLTIQNHELSDPLTSNWRSQPRIMDFVNEVGVGLFGDNYVQLTPKGKASELKPLEAIMFADKFPQGSDVPCIRATHVSAKIKSFFGDKPLQVSDKRTGKTRNIMGSDIAVLCPTNKMIAEYADVFRSYGIKVKMEQQGWQQSRIIQLMTVALSYVSNPTNLHSALYLAVTELGSLTLEEGLKQIVADKKVVDPILDKLDALSALTEFGIIPDVIDEVIETLDLYGIISGWPNSTQERANLMRLESEAQTFIESTKEALASGGYYGSGIPTFLSWLNSRAEFDDKQPEPRVVDEDAVQLITWHSSKGREWPVTIVSGLDRSISPRLPNTDVGYESFEDLDHLLAGARIEFSPAFNAPETKEVFETPLQQDNIAEAVRVLYVAFTRAKEKLVIEWPSYKDSSKTTTYWSILNGHAGLVVGDAQFAVNGESFPAVITNAGNIEHRDYDTENVIENTMLPLTGRRAITTNDLPALEVLDSMPATAVGTQLVPAFELALQTESYGASLVAHPDMSATEFGTFVHRCYEVLGHNPNKLDRINLITNRTVDSDDLQNISASVQTFRSWLDTNLKPTQIDYEVPIRSLTHEGSLVSGEVDMIVESKAGFWIVDHKTDHIDDLDAGFKHHWPQLSIYAKALTEGVGKPVLGVVINWVSLGKVTVCAIPS
jgi:ATP-dependent helicase/nuclease subunit A